jgi:hypothetical protein
VDCGQRTHTRQANPCLAMISNHSDSLIRELPQERAGCFHEVKLKWCETAAQLKLKSLTSSGRKPLKRKSRPCIGLRLVARSLIKPETPIVTVKDELPRARSSKRVQQIVSRERRRARKQLLGITLQRAYLP